MKRLKKIFLILFIIKCGRNHNQEPNPPREVERPRRIALCVEIEDVGGLTSVKDIAEYAKRKAAADLEFVSWKQADNLTAHIQLLTHCMRN